MLRIKNVTFDFKFRILNKEDPNLAYLIKQGSPLLISETENELLATSELCGFQNHTNHYYEVNNNELILLSKNQGILFEETESLVIKKEIDSEFTSHYLTQDLGIYSHYTQKEIIEQDKTLFLSLNQGARIMQGAICLGGLRQLSPNIHKVFPRNKPVGLTSKTITSKTNDTANLYSVDKI